MLGVRRACEHLVGLAAQDVDVALSPALRQQPPAGAQRAAHAREQPLVVGDPVEGGGREDRVDGLGQLELQEIALAKINLRALKWPGQPLAGGVDHRGGLVDRDHAPAWQSLGQRLGDPPRPAAGVEHGLIAAQLESCEHTEPERLHRLGDAVVAGAVPLAYWHTAVCYHVQTSVAGDTGRHSSAPGAPASCASSAITRESCPPCHAIGEGMGCPPTPASSTRSLAPGIASA